jgi:catechol 2,3-dioxygenase-like lactoylglutathione lyase family enzyme
VALGRVQIASSAIDGGEVMPDTSILDHVGLHVSDYARAKSFYSKALQPLDIKLVTEFGEAGGFGRGKPDFWISSGGKTAPMHIAFAAPTRAHVDAFYKAAMAAGGKDNGPPGLRPDYHKDYYGAFVLDPDGHNVEAVCHLPE